MSQREKLLQSILNNPRDVRFEDACKAAEMLGFTAKAQQGSHSAYVIPGDPNGLNFQNRNGKIVTYQAKQLAARIEEYLAQQKAKETK